MAAYLSSSLAFSDLNSGRHSSGLLKNTPERISKQHLQEHKMFGSKRGMHGKDIKVGRKFKKKGKGIMKSSTSGDKMSKSSGGVSPSVEQFDKMMNSISGKGSGKKKSFFSRKQFG